MQDLLGRIAALDPDASLGLRVIACFDELIVGRVNTRALLASAAALAGCAAGCEREDGTVVRVDPTGSDLAPVPGDWPGRRADPGGRVWLERDGTPLTNDAIILERLALAVAVRHGRVPHPEDERRPLGVAIDADESLATRLAAAARLRLRETVRYRVVVAPLFAVWTVHPAGPGDVVPTAHGTVHVAIVAADAAPQPTATLLGIGTPAPLAALPESFRAALTAARLADPRREPVVQADRFGPLMGMLLDAEHRDNLDLAAVDEIMRMPWGPATLTALAEAGSLRHAARLCGVHHSTIQSRLDALQTSLGFDPLDGLGRTRFLVALLTWRLRHSHAFELPSPTAGDSATVDHEVRR